MAGLEERWHSRLCVALRSRRWWRRSSPCADGVLRHAEPPAPPPTSRVRASSRAPCLEGQGPDKGGRRASRRCSRVYHRLPLVYRGLVRSRHRVGPSRRLPAFLDDRLQGLLASSLPFSHSSSLSPNHRGRPRSPDQQVGLLPASLCCSVELIAGGTCPSRRLDSR